MKLIFLTLRFLPKRAVPKFLKKHLTERGLRMSVKKFEPNRDIAPNTSVTFPAYIITLPSLSAKS